MQAPVQDRLSRQLSQVLGLAPTADEFQLARTDRRALGAQLVRHLADQPLLAPADLYRIVPRRTWIRRKAAGQLTAAEFDGLYRLVRLQLLAELVLGDAARAKAWLHSPKARLGGATPIDFAADTLGHEAIESWLHEIDEGYFA